MKKDLKLLLKYLLLFGIIAFIDAVFMRKYHTIIVTNLAMSEIAIFILAISIIGFIVTICRYHDGIIQDKII